MARRKKEPARIHRKNISDAEVLGMKLADDMFPLSLQISLSIKIAIETIELFTKKS